MRSVNGRRNRSRNKKLLSSPTFSSIRQGGAILARERTRSPSLPSREYFSFIWLVNLAFLFLLLSSQHPRIAPVPCPPEDAASSYLFAHQQTSPLRKMQHSFLGTTCASVPAFAGPVATVRRETSSETREPAAKGGELLTGYTGARALQGRASNGGKKGRQVGDPSSGLRRCLLLRIP